MDGEQVWRSLAKFDIGWKERRVDHRLKILFVFGGYDVDTHPYTNVWRQVGTLLRSYASPHDGWQCHRNSGARVGLPEAKKNGFELGCPG